MAYPAGVITRTVTFGPAFELEDGGTAGMQVTFKSTRPGVLWMETGSPAVSVSITRNADDGVEQTVDLPVTDQDGWGDGDGNAIIPGDDGHAFLYIATVIFTKDGRTIPGSQPRSKVIPIPQGDLSPLDLDKLIPLTSPGGSVVSVPDIWSEQIAQAEAAALAAANSIVNSAEFVGSEIATTGTPAEVAVAAKNEQAVSASRARLATRAGYDTGRSCSYCLAAAATATRITEAWANLTAWAVTAVASNPSVQVSGGKLFGVAGGGGANRSFRVAPNKTARVALRVNQVASGTAGNGVFIGFNRGAAGAAPSAGAAQSRGIYFRVGAGSGDGLVNIIDNGAQSTLLSNVGTVTWDLVITADENWLTFSVTTPGGGAPRIVQRWARDDATFPLNNLSIMVNDVRALTGCSVEPITEAAIGTSDRAAFTTGDTLTAGQAAPGIHWGSSDGDNFIVMTPIGYDSRKAYPTAILFHGNGSEELHWLTNTNGKAIAERFLTEGYIVVAAANTGATSTWGNDDGLNAYVRAYQYARDHYNLGPIVLYANSMGGIEALLTLAGDRIPGVAAWMGTVPTFDLDENHTNAAFTATIDSAYGGNYAANSVGHNPAVMNPLLFRGVPMWMLLATDDAAVTPGPNGFALYDAIAETNPRTKVEVTGGHSTSAIASNAAAMVSWCNSILGLRNSYPA